MDCYEGDFGHFQTVADPRIYLNKGKNKIIKYIETVAYERQLNAQT
jgi:hypothetical protein